MPFQNTTLEHFDIIKKIGDGSYSKVFQAKRIADNKLYALKIVRILQMNEKDRTNAINEVRILASIYHPNIISYKEAFFDKITSSLW
jgi:NIMA (never in mitosis gene a)-related kinase 1/4/5